MGTKCACERYKHFVIKCACSWINTLNLEIRMAARFATTTEEDRNKIINDAALGNMKRSTTPG